MLFWFATITVFFLISFDIAFYYLLDNNINSSIKERLYNKAIYIKDNISNIKNIKNSPLDAYKVAIFKQNHIIYQNKKFTLSNIQRKQPFWIHDNGEYLKATLIHSFIEPFPGKIIIIKSQIDDEVENIMDTMLILEPILLLFLIYLAGKLIDKILLPIRSITKTANQTNIDNFLSTIPEPKESDELKQLVKSFNNMIKRLKTGIDKIDRFNNDVSHELKTPLTVIKGEIEVTLDRPREPREYIKSMQVIDEEAEQIKKIVDSLLLLSKYSKTNMQNSYEICSVESILLKVVQMYSKALKEKNISLHVDKLENITTKANQVLLETIFSNLIDNAIKYTPKNRNIYVSLYQNDKIHFIIKDEGIGIPKEKLCFITDRFYRVDESRNKKIKGFGLGLSIVKNSVELHGGSLHIDSKEGVETTVHVEI